MYADLEISFFGRENLRNSAFQRGKKLFIYSFKRNSSAPCEVAEHSFRMRFSELRSFRLRVVSPTVCSPTSRVDSPTSLVVSPTSNKSVRLRLKLDLYYDNH